MGNKTVTGIWIIKKRKCEEYVCGGRDRGNYGITHNKLGATTFSTKKKALDEIFIFDMELHLMSKFEVVRY